MHVQHLPGRWPALALATLLLLSFTRAATAQISIEARPYEPVILNGQVFPEFSGDSVAVDELFLLAFDSLAGTWSQIPMQIDQVDSTGSFFGVDDGLLDDNDQIVFMARDAGHHAPLTVWPDDAHARDHTRYEIRISDPLDPTHVRWLYFYRSATLVRDNSKSYMRHLPAGDGLPQVADSIKGESYVLGHNGQTGLPDFLSILDDGGVPGQDLIDLLKVRIQTRILFFTINITEANFHALNSRVKSGPVRVLREVDDEVKLESTIFDTARILIKFYPYGVILSGRLSFQSSLGLTLLRVSLDLNPALLGMTFYNPKNGPVPVDTSADAVDESILVDPELNWDLVTGPPGTIVKLIRINLDSLQNATPALYYHDAPSGTADGTSDTGDGISFGDVGMKLTGNRISGVFPIFIATFFLPGETPAATAAALRDQAAHPLGIDVLAQQFDRLPPARIADLAIISSTPTSLTLQWTAPADDGGRAGKVAGYRLYLATEAPNSDTLGWQQRAQQIFEGLPAPGEPGTPQQMELTGLQSGTRYYVALTSVDAFGNESPLSDIVSNLTVPVELLSFSATVTDNEVHLNWVTATESNNAGFVIERRRVLYDTEALWQEIAFISGHGSSTVTHSYTYTDRVDAPGVYQYRLRQTDFDGTAERSAVVEVHVAVPTTTALHPAFPNPALQGQAMVFRYRLAAQAAVPVSLEVFNVLGQRVAELFAGRQSAGYYESRWDGRLSSGLPAPAGLYFVVLSAGNQRSIQKVMLMPR